MQLRIGRLAEVVAIAVAVASVPAGCDCSGDEGLADARIQGPPQGREASATGERDSVSDRVREDTSTSSDSIYGASEGTSAGRPDSEEPPRHERDVSPEQTKKAHRHLRRRLHGAFGRVHRKFRAPALFPASVVEDIGDWRAVLDGAYWAGDRTYHRENGDVEGYGARVSVVAADDEPDREYGSYPFRSCEALFARIEAATTIDTAGRHPWSVVVTPTMIRHDGEAIIRRDCTEQFQCSYEASREQILLDSHIGPVLSYRVVDGNTPCGSDSFATPSYRTLDLRDGERAEFTALVEPDSLVEALRNDSWVQDHVPEPTLETVDSVDELFSLSYFHQFHAYSFYDWDADRGQVAMRIWKPRVGGKWNGSFSFLGVWVTPKPQFREQFEMAAGEGGGYYMTSEHRPTF